MDIWVKDCDGCLVNLSNVLILREKENVVQYIPSSKEMALNMGKYATKQRAKEVIQLIQDYINAIGTNNFNNKDMVYVMPIE